MTDGEKPFDPIEAGFRPYPLSNTVWGADKYWDTREPHPGWKRVPGCCRIVHEDIPDPIPYYAEDRHGWRGVPSANGRTYDYETGREMRPYWDTFSGADKKWAGSFQRKKARGREE